MTPQQCWSKYFETAWTHKPTFISPLIMKMAIFLNPSPESMDCPIIDSVRQASQALNFPAFLCGTYRGCSKSDIPYVKTFLGFLCIRFSPEPKICAKDTDIQEWIKQCLLCLFVFRRGYHSYSRAD